MAFFLCQANVQIPHRKENRAPIFKAIYSPTYLQNLDTITPTK